MRKLVLASLIITSGCLVTDEIEFEEPPGITDSGSCMCALCWDRPFCQNRDTGETFERVGGNCPSETDPSEPASRVFISMTDRQAGFHCIGSMGRNVNASGDGLFCPPTEMARAMVEFLDPCVDVPVCARVGSAFENCDEKKPPLDPPCLGTFTGQRRKVCGAGGFSTGPANARSKLLDACGVYGLDVPNGPEPSRFCYVSCIDRLESCTGAGAAPPSTECSGNCDPDKFDPPQVTPSSLVLTATEALIVLNSPNGGGSFTANVSARVAIEASPSCFGEGQVFNCPTTVQSVYIEMQEPHTFLGETFRDLIATNNTPLAATYSSPGNHFGNLQVTAGVGEVYVSATIDGTGRVGESTASGSVSFWTFNFEDRTWNGAFASTILDGTGTVSISFGGELPNLSPVSNAGSDQILECTGPEGATVVLSGAESDDPDGVEDIVAHSWNIRAEGTAHLIERDGVTIVTQLPIGSHYAELLVKDTDGVTDVDGAVVVVQDTVPPTISALSGLSHEVCSATPQAVAVPTPTAADQCTAAGMTALAGAVVVTNTTTLPVPIPVTGGSVEVGPGDHVIEWVASDAGGNTAAAQQDLEVFLDRTRPIITPPPPISLQCGTSSYVEPGASVTDNCNANLAAVVGGATVDPHTAGSYTVTYNATDAAGNTAVQVTRVVQVVDSTPPLVTAPSMTIARCSPAPAAVTLTVSVSDACDAPASITLSGTLITVQGKTLPQPVAIPGNAPSVVLPVGVSVVRWVATDAHGNASAPVLQTVTVNEVDTVAACCAPGATVVEGTSSSNFLWRGLSGNYCMFGKAGLDTLVGGPGADLLSGGTGADSLDSGSSGDVLLGGAGNDSIDQMLGSGSVYGGDGDDVIDSSLGGVIHGGRGNDHIETYFGNHTIYPGSGRDTVEAGSGDDTVVVYDVCEVSSLEILNGGFGNDTLITPVPVAQLMNLGVFVIGFDNIVIDNSKRHLADCF